MLIVEVPRTYEPERRYIIDLILGEWLGFEYELIVRDRRDVEIRSEGEDPARSVTVAEVLFATPKDLWLTPAALPPQATSKLVADPSMAWSARLPVLYGSPGADGTGVVRAGGATNLTVDIFGMAFFCLSLYGELVAPATDGHGRFPAAASYAGRFGWLDRPIVDQAVQLLEKTIRTAWPDLRSAVRPGPRLRLTHDVDRPWAAVGQPMRRVAASLAADILVRKDVALLARRLRAAVDAAHERVDRDPLNRFDFFMDVAEHHDLRATFFFLAASDPRDRDFRYGLADGPIRRLLRRVDERGHEIGLHASYASHGSPERIRAELADLRDACAANAVHQEPTSVRHHFLRFEAPTTWKILDDAGLAYDWTLGYADRAGFRAGTGREFPVFDLVQRRQLALRERPLIAMDTTLVEYEGLDLDSMDGRVRSLVEASRGPGGDAVILYHNNTLPGRRFEHHYKELVAHLAEGKS